MKYTPYSHGLDDDLFPKKEPPRRRRLWTWMLVVGFGLFFVYRSILPVERLQSQPPPEFIGHGPARKQRHAESERRIAQAYWKVAVRLIQSEYSPKKSLPTDPPPDFRIDSKLAELADNVETDRVFYWRRLRDLWTQPEIWQVSYGWNAKWFTDFLTNLDQFASQALQQLVQSVRFWRDELGSGT